MSNKILGAALVVVALIAIGGYTFPKIQEAATGFAGTRFPHGVSVGTTTSPVSNGFVLPSGRELNGLPVGNCTIWAPATTIAASTTQQIVCQAATDGSIGSIATITTDSFCWLKHASSTNTTVNGLGVFGASASSTAGTIVGQLSNLTGTTFTWSAAASSSAQWEYLCVDPS